MNANVNKDTKLGVIGCGKMASAILGGIIKNSFIDNENIFIYDINEEASENLSEIYGFNKVNSIKDVLKLTNTLLLAVKPFVVDEVLKEIKENYDNQLVLSILAGVKIEKYKNSIENIKIIRIMPNTPALVGMGMSAVCPDEKIKEAEADFALDFMNNCGKAIKTTEDKIDIITALSGSGPAFYYRIIDLMAKSAQKLGLDYNEALVLSTQTALGSAKMIFENDFNVEQLIKNVTTPGGCTEVGNHVIDASTMAEILDKTIKDTTEKAIALG